MKWPAVVLMLCLGWVAAAEEVVIQSSDSTGALTFNEVAGATGYRVEWAPGTEGPWTTSWLEAIPASGSGVVTASVPMVYRVVATVPVETDMYLMVDLSGGSEATSYPASYLPDVPDGGWTEEHRTTKLVLRRIPAGTLTMGSPIGELGRLGDEIQHQVTLTRDFHIGVFEVTQEQ